MAATPNTESPTGLLAAVHATHGAINKLEAGQFKLAADWAAMHPVESIDTAATVDGTEGELAIAGPGAPLVAEFCVAELAAALDKSTDAGRQYLGDAVEVRYRLPKLWARVMAGEVPVWKARRIAQTTMSLPYDGARFVDTHVAPVARSCSFAQLDRTVEEARVRYDPDEAEQRRRAAAERRRFDIDTRHVSFDGTVRVEGELDLADAIDLDEAIRTGAQQLAHLGCTQSLDVRRSMAAGALARGQLALDLTGRQVELYVHLTPDDAIARVENTRSIASVEQIKQWCGPGAHVTIRPILDLNENQHTDSYKPTARQREQLILTHATCVFPRCSRPSRRCDTDHISPWLQGGPTDTRNLAPLCRRHHRHKTHGGWTYRRTGPRSFEWTDPHGNRHTS